MERLEYSKARRAERWLDVRGRGPGRWAYALNRLTGLGLVAYLYLHLVVLSQLLGGAKSWDAFVSLAHSPFFLGLDVALLAGILIHGLNGLRLVLLVFGIGLRVQRALFGLLMLVAIIALFVAALAIFGG